MSKIKSKHLAVTRNGKVACLPGAVRGEVCRMMYDGKRYGVILDWLKEKGFGEFNKANLSRWRAGGYGDWVKTQQWLEHWEFKREMAREQAQRDDPTFHDAGVYLAQMQFYEALNRLDGGELCRLVRKSRKEFLHLLKTFTHFNRYCLQREKFRSAVARQEGDGKDKGRRRPLRRVTMENICEEMNLV